ncbi:NAD-dependent epimerase/dehydratase [Corchorus olitorius]|uniref:NAD-dependent epimerase/dehydratase n=1 Tax=Corchorus olitorius TaxID=93759 RepID=A0A1R3GE27_9ROSI|nr:NAD-dependent epimerase/dehydratase [Corchorus olitorius]
MEFGEKGSVCVTGGTGFIGSWMIKLLLEQGYSVHTTIRFRPDPEENTRNISFLTSLPGANEKLKIFRADLSDPDSFDAAIEGCKGVIHVATPIDFQDKEPEAAVTERAINGTLGILKACLKSKTVQKVVYTSSAAAVRNSRCQDVETMDESFWTDIDFLREKKPYGSSYSISKTLTERAALEFAAQHGLDLVTIVPPLVVGPFICPKLPGSVHCLLAPILLGSQNQNESGSFVRNVSMDHHQNHKVLISYLVNASMVHVDDLSRAHIFLLEHPSAKGRYICSSHTITLEKILQILSTKYPEFSIPNAESFADFNGAKLPAGLSSRKLLDTGFKFNYGVEDMYDGAIKCCKEKGFF